jgi:hypothetical protein
MRPLWEKNSCRDKQPFQLVARRIFLESGQDQLKENAGLDVAVESKQSHLPSLRR